VSDQTGTLAEAMGLPGWSDYDLPRMTPEYMIKLLDIIGKGNHRWVTFAEYKNGKDVSQRGHILISPTGMDNIRDYRRMHIL
jgi:hypothetical protein